MFDLPRTLVRTYRRRGTEPETIDHLSTALQWSVFRERKGFVVVEGSRRLAEKGKTAFGSIEMDDTADDVIRDEALVEWVVFCRNDTPEYRRAEGFMSAPFDDWQDDDFHLDLLRMKYWHERRGPIRTMLVLFGRNAVRTVRVPEFPSDVPSVVPSVIALARADATWRRMRSHERCACGLCAAGTSTSASKRRRRIQHQHATRIGCLVRSTGKN